MIEYPLSLVLYDSLIVVAAQPIDERFNRFFTRVHLDVRTIESVEMTEWIAEVLIAVLASNHYIPTARLVYADDPCLHLLIHSTSA